MRRIIATILILLAFASIAFARDYFIYDLDGNPVPYEVCDSVIVLKFNPGLPVQSAWSLSLLYASLRDDTAATPKPHGFYQYVVSAGYEIDSVIAELRQNATTSKSIRLFRPTPRLSTPGISCLSHSSQS